MNFLFRPIIMGIVTFVIVFSMIFVVFFSWDVVGWVDDAFLGFDNKDGEGNEVIDFGDREFYLKVEADWGVWNSLKENTAYYRFSEKHERWFWTRDESLVYWLGHSNSREYEKMNIIQRELIDKILNEHRCFNGVLKISSIVVHNQDNEVTLFIDGRGTSVVTESILVANKACGLVSGEDDE